MTCTSTLLVVAVAAYLPHAAAQWDCIGTCATDWNSVECARCFDQHLEFGQIPPTAISDLLQFKLGTGYTEGWCGTNPLHPTEGVDIAQYPSGWKEKSNGVFTGCQVKTDFPGLHSTSHMNHSYVKNTLKTIPALQESGQIWRGNELGFIISNEIFWPRVRPRSVLLGSTPKQHKVLRPILEELFGSCDTACQDKLRRSVQRLFQKEQLRVQEDIVIWVHQTLFDIVFPGETNPIDVEEFVSTQSSFTTLSTLTQMIPDWLATSVVARGTIQKLNGYFDQYRPLVEKHYASRLQGMDCSPSTSCVEQLTSAFMDTFLAAGGLSVPSAISTGLWVLYGDTGKYGDTFPEKYRVDITNPLPFFFESMRFFAPVVGFPYWTTPPARASDDNANQYEGGVREILNLALANKDPNVWGRDGHKFRVKALSNYHADFIGFAETAVDPSVAQGRMDRACPGKGLALAMGKAFFANLDQDEWQTWDSPSYTEAVPFVDAFVLEKPRHKDFWSEIWDMFIVNGPMNWLKVDSRFDAYSRMMSAINAFEVAQWTFPSASDVVEPQISTPTVKVVCGLADQINVPKTDEGWQDVGDLEAFSLSTLVKGLSFPQSADQCGSWSAGQDKEQVVNDMLVAGVPQKRVLVPWTNAEKYTDQGLSDLVFHGIGQHRIRRAGSNDPHRKGATYAVYLNDLAGLETRPGFAKLGADAYFNAQGQVTHIRRGGVTYYPTGEQGWEAHEVSKMDEDDCKNMGGQPKCAQWWAWWAWFSKCSCSVPARVGWKHAKMAFLGSLNAAITAVDHLYGVHLVVANSIVTAGVEEVGPAHPLRRIMHPFGFRTAAINYKAAFALTNEYGLLHRSLPLTQAGLSQLFDYSESPEADLFWRSIPERHALQNVDFPLALHEDGADFYGVVKTYVHKYLSNYYDYASNQCGRDLGVQAWHARVNSISPHQDLEDLTCEHLEELLSTFIYYVTAGHTHVGSIMAENEDPCHMPWAWREGELCGTPRTTYTQLITFALTALEQPKLMEDYTHLFEDDVAKRLWMDFQSNLQDFNQRVRARNTNRKRPFKSFDMDYVEVSVGI